MRQEEGRIWMRDEGAEEITPFKFEWAFYFTYKIHLMRYERCFK
jgi:hypothetical protein